MRQTAKHPKDGAVVTKEVLYRFGALLVTFGTLNLPASKAVPLGIEVEILRRRLQRKARPRGKRQKNFKFFVYFFLKF